MISMSDTTGLWSDMRTWSSKLLDSTPKVLTTAVRGSLMKRKSMREGPSMGSPKLVYVWW